MIKVPKEVWESVTTLRLFCATHDCHCCPVAPHNGPCGVQGPPQSWFKDYVPVGLSDVVLEKLEEEKK